MASFRSPHRNWIAVLILIWAAMIIAAYFVIHKPLNPFQAGMILSSLVDMLVVLILVSLAAGMGRSISGALLDLNRLERASVQFALGLGCLSLWVLAAGLLGLFQTVIAWGAALVGLLIFRKAIWSWWKDLYCGFRQAAPSILVERVSLLFVGFLLLLNLTLALAPPTRWDSLVYHLEVPRRYVAAGRVSFLPDNLYAGFPGISTMWSSWAILMHAPTSAAVFGWAVGVIALLGLAGFSTRILGGQWNWLPAAILLSGSSISQALHWAYVDWWIILSGVTLWILLLSYLESHSPLCLALSGVLMGFAIGVKYTAGTLLILFTAALLFSGRQPSFENSLPDTENNFRKRLAALFSGKSWRSLLNEGVILAVVVFACVSPWLLKNFLYTGQPLYPMAMGQLTPDPWQQTFGKDPLPQRTWLEDLLLPVDATLFGIEGAQVLGKPEYSANISPLFLAFIPALWLGWKKRTTRQKGMLKVLLLLAMVNWLVWTVLSHIANELLWPRHYFGVFPVYAVLAAAGLQGVAGLRFGQVRLQRVLLALLLLVFLFSGLSEWQSWIKRNPLAVLNGVENQDAFLTRELGAYYPAMQVIQTLPENARLLFLWEPRVFYCQRECLTDATLDNWWYLRQAYSDPPNIKNQLCLQEVTHVLIYHVGVEWMQKQTSIYSDQDWMALQDFVTDELDGPVSIGTDYSIYRLGACTASVGRAP